MADLATLGFAVNSEPLARAKAAMQDMVPAAKEAGTAVDGLNAAAGRAKVANENLAAGATRTGQSLAGQSAAVQRLAADYSRLSQVQRQINSATGVTGLNMGGDRGADIAAYGQQMDALRAKFNPLFAAGQQYKATLAEINQAQRVGAISQKEYSDAIMSTKTAFTAQVNAIRGVTEQEALFSKGAGASSKATDDLAHSHAGLSTQAMAAQHSIRSMVEQLALGMPPTQILAGQLNHLSYAASGPGGLSGAFKEAGSALVGLLNPITAIVAGIVAVGAAVAVSILSWKNYALQLDDVRRIAGTTSTTLSGLNSAAAVKGIADSDFFTAMRSFSQSVYEAKINTGSLVTLLRANGMAATDVQGTFGKVADLVKNAKDDITRINILQQAGLPTTREWIDYMSQGSAAIKLIAAGMKSLGGPDNDAMVKAAKEFDDRWNQAWRNISLGVKSFGLEAFQAFDNMAKTIDKIVSSGFFSTVWTTLATIISNHPLFLGIKALSYLYDKIHGETGATAPATTPANTRVATGFDGLNRSDTANSRVSGAFDAIAAAQKKPGGSVDPNAIINANTKLIQQVSILGDLATTDQLVAAKNAELSNQFLQTGVGAGKYKDAILNLVRAQADMSRVQQQAQIGVFNLDAANKAAAETLQSWIDKKLLDPNNAEQMAAAMTMLGKQTRDMSDAAKVAGSNLPQLQQALNDVGNMNKTLDQFATGSINTLTTGLADIADGTKSVGQGFADLGKSILRMLTEAAIKAAIVAPIIKSVFGGGLGGGIFSLLGMNFGDGGVNLGSASSPLSGLSDADYAANGKVFPFANGGAFTNSVVNQPTMAPLAMFGEAGPEAIMPLRRDASGRLGVSMHGGGGGQSVSFGDTHIVIQGNADENTVQSLTKQLAAVQRSQATIVKQAASQARFQQNGNR